MLLSFILLSFFSGEGMKTSIGTLAEIFYFLPFKKKKKKKVLSDILSVCVGIKVYQCILFKTTLKSSRHKYSI